MGFLKRFHNTILATATLVGTIIGVGMFGLPFVTAQSGLVPALFFLVVLGSVVTILHLLYGEVVLRTTQKHRLTGYAGIYLGPVGKIIAAITFFFGLFGGLLAYLIIGGQFMHLLLPAVSPVLGSIILLVGGGVIISGGFRDFGFFELLMGAILLSLVLGLVLYGTNFFSAAHFVLWGSTGALLAPYGVFLFALWGNAAIPEIRDFFTQRPQNLRRAIIWGTLIPVGIYSIFTIAVVGMSGAETSRDAIAGLVPVLGTLFTRYGAAVGLLAVLTSFITIGITVKNALRYDIRLPHWPSMLAVIIVPALLFVAGLRDFIGIIDWVGAVLVGVEGVLLLAMHARAQKKGARAPEYTVRLSGLARYGLAAVLLIALGVRFL